MREGEQPRKCIVESCERPPMSRAEVMCAGHLKAHASNGTATTPPVVEPDDPALIERTDRQAAAQEAKEYAERRRVKTWKTLENGSRVPEEFWTDDELAAIEARAEEDVEELKQKMGASLSEVRRDPLPPDPEKAQLKLLKRALRGRQGTGAQKMVQALVDYLEQEGKNTPPTSP